MCTCIGVSALRFGPHTNAEPISPHMTSVEALYCALHPPLPASKNRSDFVGLRGDTCSHCTGEVQAGTGISRWYQLRSYHALCKFENIGYVEVPEDHLYNTQNSERSDEVSLYLMVACVQMLWENCCFPSLLGTKPSRGPCHTICHLPALVGNGIKLFGGWWWFWMISYTYYLFYSLNYNYYYRPVR